MTRKRPPLITPATGVLAVALAATVVTGTAVAAWHFRGELPATGEAAPEPAPAYTIAGSVSLKAGQWTADGSGCRSTTVSPEAVIVVTDKQGASLAYAPLQAGRLADGRCALPFTLTVPAGAGTYAIDVPTVGRMDYSEGELADMLELAIS